MSDLGPQAAGGDHAAREPIRVLVVEDSSSGAAAVLDAIEQGGLRPAHLRVQSPAELERALAHPDGWDVVLTAAALQSWSGLDAIRMVVALRPQLPVLMVSGAATEEQAVAAMRAGAADCVLEDNLSRLGPALRRALAEARRRRRHEHALRELRLAHTSLDGIRDAVFWMDRAGRIVLANEAACRAFGRPRAELLGRPIGDVLVALGDGSWSEHWRGLEERGRLAFESALPTAGGGLLTVAVDETLLVFEGEAYVLALVRDVTAEREAERRSRQAMAETSALLEGARAVLDEPTFELSAGRILRSCLRLVGADAGYMGLQRIGEPTWDVLVVETGARARQADPAGMAEVCGLRARACQERRAVFANELEGGAGLLPEGHLALDNALVAPLMLEREVAGVLALANKPGGFDDEDARAVEAFAEVASVALKDLRTRQALAASAEQVQRSERRYRRTFETAANLMTSVDAQGTIVDCNERALEVLGYRPDELIGRPMGRIIHPDCHARAHAALETTLREGQLHGETYRMVRKDGEAIDVRINSSAIREGDEGDARTLCVIDDITERNRIQTRLAQSDRLASVGMLAAGVAHEVNNPLTYILYNLESLRVELPEVVTAVDAALQQWPGGDGAWDRLRAARRSLTELAECAAVAQDGARRVARIVRDLKTFSRTDEEDRAPIDVELVIESALSMVFHEVKYRATVVKDYGRVPAVVGNEGRLGQVFLNLLLNAAQAIDEGAVRANEIRVRTYVDDGWAVSEIRDTGGGIPPEHLGRLFDPFFTTKPKGVGSGLGLSICRDIVTSMGGTLTVESEVGHGTTFRLRLPLPGPAGIQAVAGRLAVEPPTDPGPGPRLRILAVDDEAMLRRLYRRALGRHHDVVLASSGQEAMELLERDDAFDIVLTDLMMPHGCGVDLYEWITAHRPGLKARVVFVSGGVFTVRARDLLTRIDNARVDKPLTAEHLRELVAGWAPGASPPG